MKELVTEHIIKINLPGGIVPAGDLYDILTIAGEAGIQHIRFGNRQQLYFTLASDKLEDLQDSLQISDISYETDADDFPNIVSSYVTDDIFDNPNWLKEGVYKDILDLFNFQPKLKINLVDNNQTFIPFFTGNINFIASDISNYWYLYVRFPKTSNIYCWPVLIYSDDIPAISKSIEEVILEEKELFYDQAEPNGKLLHQKVSAKAKFVIQPYEYVLKLPEFYLPYYEGFNRYSNDKFWLGVYRRDELFSLSFLKDICALCIQTRVGQLYTTPWKSIVIKGIRQEDRKYWGIILNRHRINVRHASNELNWQVEDLCEEGLRLKTELVKEFEDADLRTYRLCFAIKTQPKTGLFGSVVIRKRQIKSAEGEDLFEIMYTRDFNPNSKDFIVFRQNVKRERLLVNLLSLCDYYYGLQSDPDFPVEPDMVESAGNQVVQNMQFVYQCKHCLSIYDEVYGDEVNGISAGTDFKMLGIYNCPVCDAPKEDFEIAESLQHI